MRGYTVGNNVVVHALTGAAPHIEGLRMRCAIPDDDLCASRNHCIQAVLSRRTRFIKSWNECATREVRTTVDAAHKPKKRWFYLRLIIQSQEIDGVDRVIRPRNKYSPPASRIKD